MKESTLRFVILTALFEVALCAFTENHTYINKRKTWREAREYCRQHFTDLSSISSQVEDDKLIQIRGQNWFGRAWIGLYKDDNDSWKWSGGKNASFFNWAGPRNKRGRCVAQSVRGWHKVDCKTSKLHFYCFQRILVLVKENVTWEEAMEQCHQQHSDLVSLPTKSALVKTQQASREAQTDHLWISLRYLADSWLWVNGDNMTYQAWRQGEMPQCPASTHHCGALSLEGEYWDRWDCADTLNFVCY